MSGFREEAELLQLLKQADAVVVREHGHFKLWKIGNAVVSVPVAGAKGDSPHSWSITKTKIRRAMRAAGVEDKVAAPRKAEAPSNGTAVPVVKVVGTPQRGSLPDDPVLAARALSEHSLWLAGALDEFAQRVETMVHARGAAEHALIVSREETQALRKQLDTKGAELATFNGRDWPKELETAVAQRKAEQARSAELAAQVQHLKSALRSLDAGRREEVLSATEIETVAAPANTGTTKLVRHIVFRTEAAVAEVTLCGKPWDRLNPMSGEYCTPCVQKYREIRPGWPLPGRPS